ncbi:MAG: prepilin-type N-terminal cleavage/methylation domain-containing protein [Phycisphaerae bacterium]
MNTLKPNFKRSSRRGFTMAEVTIAVALSAMIAVAIASAMYAAGRSYRINSERARLLAESRKLMMDFSADIRSSEIHRPVKVNGDGNLEFPPVDFQNGNISNGLQLEAQLAGADIQNAWLDAAVASSVQTFYQQTTYYYTQADRQVKTREVVIRRYSNGTADVPIASTVKNDTVSYYVQGFEVRSTWTDTSVLYRCVFQVEVANTDASGGILFTPGNQTNTFRLTESVMPRRNFRNF